MTTVAQVHREARDELIEGLLELGILEGAEEDVLESEAHKLFFPHQTSHWLGLDVHDVGDYSCGSESRVLEPGMVLIQGENGEGKSNLLEALYTLAIAKSHRASNERELVRRQAATEESHAQVSAVVERDGGSVRVQIDLRGGAEATEAESGVSFQKYVRVNGEWKIKHLKIASFFWTPFDQGWAKQRFRS